MTINQILSRLKTWLLGKFALASDLSAILEKIPNQASSQNQLADKAFVNSTVQTGTANFRGVFNSFFHLLLGNYERDYTGSRTPTVNDYAVLLDASVFLDSIETVYKKVGVCYYVDNEIYVIDGVVDKEVVDFHKIADISRMHLQLEADLLFDSAADREIEIYGIYKYRGKYYARIVRYNEGEVFDISDRSKWTKISDGRNNYDESLTGTWRLKYTENWADAGVSGWHPEYQVNREPLTAAQSAALNSNITYDLVRKIADAIGVSGNVLGTVAQALTPAEQAQARANIGATAPEIFWASYGTTTAAEIETAATEGKVVLCTLNKRIYTLASHLSGDVNYIFSSIVEDMLYILRVSRGNNLWQNISIRLQRKDIITQWNPIPSETKYPCEKLVKESLDEKYVKPENGIPKSDLESSVRTTLRRVKTISNKVVASRRIPKNNWGPYRIRFTKRPTFTISPSNIQSIVSDDEIIITAPILNKLMRDGVLELNSHVLCAGNIIATNAGSGERYCEVNLNGLGEVDIFCQMIGEYFRSASDSHATIFFGLAHGANPLPANAIRLNNDGAFSAVHVSTAETTSPNIRIAGGNIVACGSPVIDRTFGDSNLPVTLLSPCNLKYRRTGNCAKSTGTPRKAKWTFIYRTDWTKYGMVGRAKFPKGAVIFSPYGYDVRPNSYFRRTNRKMIWVRAHALCKKRRYTSPLYTELHIVRLTDEQ